MPSSHSECSSARPAAFTSLASNFAAAADLEPFHPSQSADQSTMTTPSFTAAAATSVALIDIRRWPTFDSRCCGRRSRRSWRGRQLAAPARGNRPEACGSLPMGDNYYSPMFFFNFFTLT
jgi:hypothetical protein